MVSNLGSKQPHLYSTYVVSVAFQLHTPVSSNSKLTAPANLVSIIPGAMQLTRILSGANSKLNAFVSPNNAVLLTEYGIII